jgi:hypothetical protein
MKFALTLLLMSSLARPTAPAPEPTVEAGALRISPYGHQFVIRHECGGQGYYNQRYQRPQWPGGASGVTVGIGYDLGYNTRAQIARDWSHLDASRIAVLQSVAGIKGQPARARLPGVRHIIISWEEALRTFDQMTLPRFGNMTYGAFPQIVGYHGHCQATLLSLVFNRGASKTGDSRREMAWIARDLAVGKPEAVPQHIEDMRRLWVGKGLDGLLRRRMEEAALWRRGIDSGAVKK